jgi:hypothetical protein
MVPDDIEVGICSTEMYVIRPKAGAPLDRFALLAALRSQRVLDQARDLVRGSSSSRPRIGVEDFKSIRVPVPAPELVERISRMMRTAVEELWGASRRYFDSHRAAFEMFGEGSGLEERWDRAAVSGKGKRKARTAGAGRRAKRRRS